MVETCCKYIPYSDTGSFTQIVLDYLAGKNELKDFYTYAPDEAGIVQAITERSEFPVNRQILVDTLQKQYASLKADEKVMHNIALLAQENTFTICTAHQPNLLTGYLYFIYKIAHAIKLADVLKDTYPDKHFVPVYYMGSEDNDLEELGTFRYSDKKFTWNGAGQQGAVGRMDTASVSAILDELFHVMGPPGPYYDELKNILIQAYLHHATVGAATQYLVNELFGRFGLVVLDPDTPDFKRQIVPIMEKELLGQTSYSIVTAQAEKLSRHYKVQAQPRAINMFYLNEQLRERIESNGTDWHVVNTDISWNKEELLEELHDHPERFSPNVILRGVFQETILPNIVFIGGGGEVAYWLQLKDLFKQYNIFFPVILLRQSILWIDGNSAKLKKQFSFTDQEIFANEILLLKNYVQKNSEDDLDITPEQNQLEESLHSLKRKATTIDSTLRASAEAALAKIRYQLQVLEKKMLRAEKKKMQVQLSRISKLKSILFPGGSLQERVENFTTYYLQYGPEYIDIIIDSISPLRNEFLIIEPSK